ncbi:MAG TPA: SoxR reducing system RseC family protein [Bacteroidales bacterium]|jgi:sigma-E factor negative regulatory protein RseC|nr:SoxR reducing system RseC family protein [Bacteroidales bacterium]HOS72381.1 SoxR reducing system RseC family protein [Bacteroidales bacterium]HQH25300.1 SoxR reducing system RseC family protein [Bacteroidales bacterium]HQJ82478.1 SoxR reducing system RseC family protein [Bacteroidales bacterium]
MNRSNSYDNIEHEGTVQRSDSNLVIVSISSEAACSACHAKGACSLSGAKEKLIEIPGRYDLVPGDNVTVVMHRSAGFRAVLFAYVLPFILLIPALLTLSSLGISEPAAALGSVAVVSIYYLVLFFFRDRIANNFTFSIKTP